jgi:hypothetical protein
MFAGKEYVGAALWKQREWPSKEPTALDVRLYRGCPRPLRNVANAPARLRFCYGDARRRPLLSVSTQQEPAGFDFDMKPTRADVVTTVAATASDLPIASQLGLYHHLTATPYRRDDEEALAQRLYAAFTEAGIDVVKPCEALR